MSATEKPAPPGLSAPPYILDNFGCSGRRAALARAERAAGPIFGPGLAGSFRSR
jgi:hypothetical protein